MHTYMYMSAELQNKITELKNQYDIDYKLLINNFNDKKKSNN